MDKLSKKTFSSFVVAIVVLTLLSWFEFIGSNNITLNGFVSYSFAMFLLCVAAGDFIVEQIIKKNTVLLIVDGETKESLNIWVKKELFKLQMYGLAVLILSLVLFHFVARPLQGFVHSVNDIPWMGIIVCILSMVLINYLVFGISEALVLRQLRLNKQKTYFFIGVLFYTAFDSLMIIELSPLLFYNSIFGVILFIVNRSIRAKEIRNFYEVDIT